MLNRSTPPPFVVPHHFEIPRATKHILANGNTLYSNHTDNDALLKIDVCFPAGRLYQKQPSVAALTIDMLFESTRKRSALAMAEALDFYGAYTDYSARAEWASITLYTLNKHLGSVLPYFIELLTEPAFDSEELKDLISREIQDLKVALEKNSVITQQEVSRRQWGVDHPLGMTPSVANYESMDKATIQEFYDKHYRLGEARLFVAGNITPAVIETLSAAFSVPVEGYRAEKALLSYQPTVGEKVFLEKPKSLQAAIRMVRKHVPRNNPDYNDTQLLNLILGGYFGSRLMDNLREEKGYTYGIGSSITDFHFCSEWSIGTEVKNEVKDDAVKEIFLEMERLMSTPVDEDELEVAKNYLLGQILRSLDGAYQHMKYAETVELNQYSYEMLYEGFNRILTITPEDLQRVAKKYLNPAEWLVVVCGSAS